MSFFNNNRKFEMDIHTADSTLQNIFSACRQKPNSVAFQKLLVRRHFRGLFFNLGMAVSILFFILTLLTPYLFLSESISLTTYASQELTLVSHKHVDRHFYLTFEPADISVEDCYMINADGKKTPPSKFTPETGTLVFPFPGEEVNIFIFADDGSHMQLLLNMK